MSCLNDDLEKFLKSDGIRSLMDSGILRIRQANPLSEEEIEELAAVDLDGMSREELEELQDQAEDLLDNLEDEEPEDEDSEEYNDWEGRFSDVEDFIERIGELLDGMNEEEEKT